MDKEELKELLKRANLSKKELAGLTDLAHSTVNNWGSGQNVPHWVKSWLENYIKAENYKEIKDKIFETEDMNIIMFQHIFKEVGKGYHQSLVHVYEYTQSIELTIQIGKIAKCTTIDALHFKKCSKIHLQMIYDFLQSIDFHPDNEQIDKIANCINGKGY